MRQVAIEIANALYYRKARKLSNTETDGKSVWLHGNKIAELSSNGWLRFTLCGWNSVTTRSRLNDLFFFLGCSAHIYTKNYDCYLSVNGKEVADFDEYSFKSVRVNPNRNAYALKRC